MLKENLERLIRLTLSQREVLIKLNSQKVSWLVMRKKKPTGKTMNFSRRIRVSFPCFNLCSIEEQIERNQVFFILEQFFAHAKTSQDPMNKAQEAIEEYFKDTENTFFFDKNKIQWLGGIWWWELYLI